MNFIDAIKHAPFILAEGSVIERLRRDFRFPLDRHILSAGWIYHEKGREELEKIYRGYLDIGTDNHLPMIVFTPTWRANPERLKAAGFGEKNAVNADCVKWMMKIRESYGEYFPKIFIGGLMGPRGDAYNPTDALPTEEAAAFHRPQANELAEAGVDFLEAATLPALSEALGIAKAMAAIEKPYILSFIIRDTGTLLDGTSLHQAISTIDDAADPQPLGYMINCVHPAVFAKALQHEIAQSKIVSHRVLGLQANTSDKSPEELDGSETLDREDPAIFAQQMHSLLKTLSIKILGGCCGTDDNHIRSIARMVSGFAT